MGISVGLGLSALLPAGLGFRNLLINGEFRINQRGYASASNLASGSYGFDRWKSSFTNTTLTFTSASQGQIVTINSGGSIKQIIERENVSAGTYILSWTGTATGRVYNTGATPPSYAASPLFVTLDGLANVEVEFTASGGTQTLWKPQLEANYQATPFEQRPYGIELALCQRYYEKSYAFTTAPGTATYDRLVTMTGSAGSATTGEIIGNYYWAAVKRVAPTVAWYDHGGNSNRVTRLQYGVANHGNNVAAAGTVTEVMAVVSSTSGNTGQSLQFHFVADVEL